MSADYFLTFLGDDRAGFRAVTARLEPLLEGDRHSIALGPQEYVEVYGLDDDTGGLMLSRLGGDASMDLVHELMTLGDAFFCYSSGVPLMVIDEAMRDRVLAIVGDDAPIEIVRSGRDIDAALAAYPD